MRESDSNIWYWRSFCGSMMGGGTQPDEVLAEDTHGANIDDRFF
jgi:hypothetical protein